MIDIHTTMSEAVLVKRLQADDEEAFRLLVQQYHQSMVRLALAIVCEMSIAEDIVQETWLAVLKAIHKFEGRSTIKTWLFSIVINRARTCLKREQRHSYQSRVSLDAQEGMIPEFITLQMDFHPETIAVNHELQNIVSKAISLLPQTQQNIIRLRHFDGFSADEVSQQLGISEINQRVLLHRARKQMRIRLISY